MSGTKELEKIPEQSEGPITDELRTELLAEYSALRSEVLSRIRMRHQLVTFTIAILGVLVTVSAQKEVTALMILLYPLLSLFLALGWAHNDYRVGQISKPDCTNLAHSGSLE